MVACDTKEMDGISGFDWSGARTNLIDQSDFKLARTPFFCSAVHEMDRCQCIRF
jgi:hypothetical protein